MAASLELANDPTTGGPVKFALEEIRREAAAKGMTLGEGTSANRIALTAGKEGNAAAQSYNIRVQNMGAAPHDHRARGRWSQRDVWRVGYRGGDSHRHARLAEGL